MGMRADDDILSANERYYQAFEAGDFPAMSNLWAEDGVSCIHPGWPVLVGRQAILESYRAILSNPSQDPIIHHSDTVIASGTDGRVFCVELVGEGALAATNWFRLVNGVWRMVHHQASPLATADSFAPDRPSRLN